MLPAGMVNRVFRILRLNRTHKILCKLQTPSKLALKLGPVGYFKLIGWDMIRLVLAIGIATALWPVDEHDRPLSVGNTEVNLGDVMSAGYTVLDDLAGFCGRNEEACETVTAIVVDTTENKNSLSAKLSASMSYHL